MWINRGRFRCDFKILSHFSMKFLCANRIAPDGTPRSAASHLGLFCLPMSHKRDDRLKLVKSALLRGWGGGGGGGQTLSQL